MSKRIIIITQGVSRIVEPIVEKYNVVGIIESAPRKKKKGFVKRNLPVKILGNGELEKALKVQAHKFSKSAEKKINDKGGSIEVL